MKNGMCGRTLAFFIYRVLDVICWKSDSFIYEYICMLYVVHCTYADIEVCISSRICTILHCIVLNFQFPSALPNGMDDDDVNADDTKIKMPNAIWNETIYWTLRTDADTDTSLFSVSSNLPILLLESPLFVHDMSIEMVTIVTE